MEDAKGTAIAGADQDAAGIDARGSSGTEIFRASATIEKGMSVLNPAHLAVFVNRPRLAGCIRVRLAQVRDRITDLPPSRKGAQG